MLLRLIDRKIFRLVPDKQFVSLKYRLIMGHWPNLDNPSLMSEKIQWLKLNDFNELYPKLVDKYLVRDYVANKIGSQYLVPLLGVWDNAASINWDLLPEKFVLKCTHGSHTNIICKDKDSFDTKAATKQLNKWLRSQTTYYYGREWPYKFVKPRIIAEKYIESNKAGGIQDFKFLCFNGVPDNVMVCSDRETGHVRFDHFDNEWNFLRYQYVDIDKEDGYTIPKPEKIDEMFEIARQLSKDLPFVRVDLYCENNTIYFGELTFYPQSGYDTDFTVKTDQYFGDKMKIYR